MPSDRPLLVYPPTGARVVGQPPPSPHPPPPTAATPSGGTAIAPIVTYADPDPLPSSPAKPGGRGAHYRGVRRRSLLGVVLALLGAILALFLGIAHHSGHPAGSVSAGDGRQPPGRAPAVPGSLRAHHGGGPRPITLPGPEGDAARTIPLDTIWVIDETLPAADQAALSREAPVDVTYLATYSLPGDRLAFTLRPKALKNIEAHESSLSVTAAHPAEVLAAEPSRPLHLPPVAAGHDRAIVIITTRPARWRKDLPSGPTPPAPTPRSRPGKTFTYILRLRPGSGRHADPFTSSDIQPQQLTADPMVRGDIARALARAFVNATGAIWPA
jgi:hypothetical protein